MNGEPCDDCRRNQIRIGVTAAIVSAVVTGAVLWFGMKGVR